MRVKDIVCIGMSDANSYTTQTFTIAHLSQLANTGKQLKGDNISPIRTRDPKGTAEGKIHFSPHGILRGGTDVVPANSCSYRICTGWLYSMTAVGSLSASF